MRNSVVKNTCCFFINYDDRIKPASPEVVSQSKCSDECVHIAILHAPTQLSVAAISFGKQACSFGWEHDYFFGDFVKRSRFDEDRLQILLTIFRHPDNP